MIINHDSPTKVARYQALGSLNEFRTGMYRCFTRRADVLFELTDAVLCAPGPVTDLAHLSLEPAHRRGHGALYDALNTGQIDTEELGQLVAATPLPRLPGPDGRDRIVLAVDVSNWLRPDAATSPDRCFCHTYPRGRGQAQMIPGWRYLWIAALTPGTSSWTALLETRRLHADEDETMVTAERLKAVFKRLHKAGHWNTGDPDLLVVMDSGYDATRLSWLLTGLPLTLLARVRSNRVFHAPAGKRKGPTKGRGPRHGNRLTLSKEASWPQPAVTTINTTPGYGSAVSSGWHRMHQRLEHRGGWATHPGTLPIIEGSLIRLTVDHLTGGRAGVPVWLWCSDPEPEAVAVDHYWSMYLRRFDLEHTFRFLKQSLGWTRPMLRDPEAADRWSWLILAAHTQLRLAQPLASDVRLPWQRPLPTTALTPARVRRTFPRVHASCTQPASAPIATRAGPGRPPGSRNHRKAPIQPIGKTAQQG